MLPLESRGARLELAHVTCSSGLVISVLLSLLFHCLHQVQYAALEYGGKVGMRPIYLALSTGVESSYIATSNLASETSSCTSLEARHKLVSLNVSQWTENIGYHYN